MTIEEGLEGRVLGFKDSRDLCLEMILKDVERMGKRQVVEITIVLEVLWKVYIKR